MSDTDPFAPVLGASDPGHPAQQGPRRTLGGALATVLLVVAGTLAAAAPTAALIGLLFAVAVGALAGFTAGLRQCRERPVRLCLPLTGRCLRF